MQLLIVICSSSTQLLKGDSLLLPFVSSEARLTIIRRMPPGSLESSHCDCNAPASLGQDHQCLESAEAKTPRKGGSGSLVLNMEKNKAGTDQNKPRDSRNANGSRVLM
eukprot:scaffold8971_cov112-Cylindrotheca_fusiformis.AAC.1